MTGDKPTENLLINYSVYIVTIKMLSYRIVLFIIKVPWEFQNFESFGSDMVLFGLFIVTCVT
jgi:hypothetical protein